MVGLVIWRHVHSTLSEIGESHDISCIVGVSRLIGHPYLHTVDGDTCGQIGQCFHGAIVSSPEIFREEEVSVFLIVGSIYLKWCELYATFRRRACGRRLFL